MLVALAALLVVGPKELPSLLRRMGVFAGGLRRQAQEFRHALESMDQPRRPPLAKRAPYPEPNAPPAKKPDSRRQGES